MVFLQDRPAGMKVRTTTSFKLIKTVRRQDNYVDGFCKG
jgi:hypothetical protein